MSKLKNCQDISASKLLKGSQPNKKNEQELGNICYFIYSQVQQVQGAEAKYEMI